MSESITSRQGSVLVVGAGIAGLSAALRLRALNPLVHITIVEATRITGGKIIGEIVDGCVVDGAADVCIGDKLRRTHMFAALGLANRVIPANPNSLPTYEWTGTELKRVATSFAGELLSFRGGMRELVEVATVALNDVTLVFEQAVDRVTPTDSGWTIECKDGAPLRSDAIVIATPAAAAAHLLCDVAPREAAALSTLTYPSTTTVTMAWRNSDVPCKLDGTGYVTSDTAAAVSACTWVSSKHPTHTAPGVTLLRGYVRGDAGSAVALMRNEVATVIGITAAPVFARVNAWEAGIPVYTEVHRANVSALRERFSSVSGLFVAGAAFDGVGIPDCILSGERAAADAVQYIGTLRTEAAA